jgi:hypothetical protein
MKELEPDCLLKICSDTYHNVRRRMRWRRKRWRLLRRWRLRATKHRKATPHSGYDEAFNALRTEHAFHSAPIYMLLQPQRLLAGKEDLRLQNGPSNVMRLR